MRCRGKLIMDLSLRILILGAGPTGLGAAYRLQELGSTNFLVLESRDIPGGLASSVHENGYTWDMGGHVTFSHYEYYDNVTRKIPCNMIPRESYIWHENKYVPYPIQQSISELKNAKEIQESYRNRTPIKSPQNFQEYLTSNFGQELCNEFMIPYNQKVWQTSVTDMSHTWVGERVAAPNFDSKGTSDRKWGPNSTFRYPKEGGNGKLWTSIASELASDKLLYNTTVTSINTKEKILTTQKGEYKYDVLITTIPLDVLNDLLVGQPIPSSKDLKKTRLRITGIGFDSKLPLELENKSWIYYSKNEPAYRVTVLSSYSQNMCPVGKWSLLCESNANITLEQVTEFFSGFGKISATWTTILEHGYPVPTVNRDTILEGIHSILEPLNIYSRGRFGGWKYEVSNQDHSFLQGVEVVDRILLDVPEVTYPNPWIVNSGTKVVSTRKPKYPEVELVVAHYSEDLTWLQPYSKILRLYTKSSAVTSQYLNNVAHLNNVGRETHTYLTHIINNWDNLADITIFNQGSISDHSYYTYSNPLDHLKYMQNGISFKVKERYDNWGRLTHIGRWLQNLIDDKMTPAKYTLAKTWLDLFGYEHPKYIEVCYAACFAVTREQIHKRPKKFYEKCLSYVSETVDPEEGHYFERLWCSIFTDDTILQERK